MKNQTVMLLMLCIVTSLLIFISCGLDKLFSKYSFRRIPEKFFLILSVLGGGIGLCLGMLAFHHKTNHWYFRLCAVLSGTFWLATITFMLLKTAAVL